MDQIIDAAMARSIQIDVARQHTLIAWIIQHDLPDHPGKDVARLRWSIRRSTCWLGIRWPRSRRCCHPGWISRRACPTIRRTWSRYGSHPACLGDQDNDKTSYRSY